MNSDCCNPLRPIFGAGPFSRLGEPAAGLGEMVRAVIGVGAKRWVTHDRAIAGLKAAGPDFAGCSGAEPGSQILPVASGAAIVREEGCDATAAPGGAARINAVLPEEIAA